MTRQSTPKGGYKRQADKVYEMYLDADPLSLSTAGTHKLFRFHSTSPAFAAHSVTFMNPSTRLTRDYSPLSVSLKNGRLYFDFIIKIYNKGEMTQWLNKLKEGDLVICREPTTTSITSQTPHGCWQQMLMFCAGTGMTPMLNMISKHYDALQEREPDLVKRCRVVVIWWLPNLEDFFLDEATLYMMTRQFGKRINFHIQFTQAYGDITDSWKSKFRILSEVKAITVGGGRDMEQCMKWGKDQLKYDSNFSGRIFICGTEKFEEAVDLQWKRIGSKMLTEITVIL